MVREAAAAHNGEGIEWDENDLHSMDGHQVILAMATSLSPIVLRGQHLLLDNRDRPPVIGDLVAVETESGDRYLRRFWTSDDGSLLLEAANVTGPVPPVHIRGGIHNMRRIAGVLFGMVELKRDGKLVEWTPTSLRNDWFEDVAGLRIKGTSMEPIVREGQTVLVRKGNDRKINRGDLGCVDIAEGGTVIKRCYPLENEWVLCSVNPTDPEDPMRVKSRDILHAYPLVGVIFELSEREA